MQTEQNEPITVADTSDAGGRLWTVADVAEFLGVSCDTVRANARARKIPGRKVLGKWKFRPRAIKEMLP